MPGYIQQGDSEQVLLLLEPVDRKEGQEGEPVPSEGAEPVLEVLPLPGLPEVGEKKAAQLAGDPEHGSHFVRESDLIYSSRHV